MPHSQELHERLLEEIMTITAVDVHSHVPAAAPYARSLRDLLGYHYYTELAHSSGMARQVIAPDRPDEEMIPELLEAMGNIDNTVQYSWMVELARDLFDFPYPRLTPDNWQRLAREVEARAERPDRAREILQASRIDRVFLTNSFDEDLEDIDTRMFVPSLRADTLVFELADPQVAARLQEVTGVSVADSISLQEALGTLVQRFVDHGARSVAISLPPGFICRQVEPSDLNTALADALAGRELDADSAQVLQSGVLVGLTDLCADHRLPFQIMYGVVRDAYLHGVPQGTDLPHAGMSLHGLMPLLNGFPEVTFCLSILSDSQVQELNSYGWIVQNVVLSGHWWYLNVPAYIGRDLAARLQSTPKNKLIGYYSDMYKLEFGLAKFNMYRRVLARTLARDFVEVGLGSEQEAADVARLLLRENPARIFRL